MIGLMTVFFGQFVDIAAEPGYFYLCPKCFVEKVEPHLDEEEIRDSLLLREERRKLGREHGEGEHGEGEHGELEHGELEHGELEHGEESDEE